MGTIVHCTGCGETWTARVRWHPRMADRPCPATGTGEMRPATLDEIVGYVADADYAETAG